MTELSQEQQIMQVMRQTLTAIIKDVTPPPGMRHPLSEATIQQLRQCLGLITAREQELAAEQGRGGERPYYSDERQEVQLVTFETLKRKPN